MWKVAKVIFWVVTGVFWIGVLGNMASKHSENEKDSVEADAELRRLTQQLNVERAASASTSTMVETTVQSVIDSPGMSDEILSRIREDAKSMFPGDYSTQKYYIRQQKKGYEEVENFNNPNVPEKTLNRIKRDAKRMFKHDYSTQSYYLRKQVDDYLDIE